MRKVLEDLRLARIDTSQMFDEIVKIKGPLTPGQVLGVCEVAKKIKTGEVNVDEAEQRLNEILG